MNELAGQNLGGYHLKEEVGRGAMGVVYRGKQLVLGREVAIKVLPQTLARDSSYVARFTREAKIMANAKARRARFRPEDCRGYSHVTVLRVCRSAVRQRFDLCCIRIESRSSR